MRRWLWLVVLFIPIHADAWMALCGNVQDTVALDAGISGWRFNVDASELVPLGPCCLVSKTDTAAQRALVTSQGFDRRKHKLASGDGSVCQAIPKSQATIDAIVAADTAAEAVAAAFTAELASNDLCNTASFATLETRIDTLTNAIGNLAEAKTALNTALKKIARCFVAFRQRQ